MTEVFHYQNLTWPEVAALDRQTPLVLPVGLGYAASAIVEQLGSPDDLGILPSIPFGWQGSNPAVTARTFHDLLSNLCGNLQEDGFTNIHVILPDNISFGLGPLETHLSLKAIHKETLPDTKKKVNSL